MLMLSKHTSPKVNEAKFMKFMYTSRVFCDDTRMWTCAVQGHSFHYQSNRINLTSYRTVFVVASVLLTPCKVIRIPKSGQFQLVECKILVFGIRNPAYDWNRESKFHQIRMRNLLSGILDLQRGIQILSLSCITWGEF